MSEPSWVCLDCGERRMTQAALRWHWETAGHGPWRKQLDALDRARASIGKAPDQR